MLMCRQRENPMADSPTFRTTVVTLKLRALRFTPHGAARLAGLKRRYERGDLQELSDEQRRLCFVRWLVEQGRLNEAESARPGERRTACRMDGAASPAACWESTWRDWDSTAQPTAVAGDERAPAETALRPREE